MKEAFWKRRKIFLVIFSFVVFALTYMICCKAYYGKIYFLGIGGSREEWNIERLNETAKDFYLDEQGAFVSSSPDPWFTIEEAMPVKTIVIDIEAVEENGNSQVFYYSDNQELKEEKSYWFELHKGLNYLQIPKGDYNKFRLDLTEQSNVRMTINSIVTYGSRTVPMLFLAVVIGISMVIIGCIYKYLANERFNTNISSLSKKKIMVVSFLICVLLLCSYTIILCFKYPEQKIDMAQLYGLDNVNLKDFEVSGEGLVSTSDDPWIEFSLDKEENLKIIELQYSGLEDKACWGCIWNTDTWDVNYYQLKNGKNFILFDETITASRVQHLRFDLVEQKDVYFQLDGIILNSRQGIIWLVIKKWLKFVFLLMMLECLLLISLDKPHRVPEKKVNEPIEIRMLIIAIVSMLCSIYFVKYMRIPQSGIIQITVFIIIFFLFSRKKKNNMKILNIVFACILSIAIILGYHMKLNGSMYFGLVTENYMTSLSMNDAVALILLTITINAILMELIEWIESKTLKIELKETYGICNKKMWYRISILIFVAWMPYFLTYYPGFIFGDSLSSIGQALGKSALNNHHPIFYTLFLKECLSIGIQIKDITLGCAIYSVIQMMYIAFCLAYQVCWIRNKGISKQVCLILVVFYACTPFFAQNSIAMWKDPIFSATLSLWTILIWDFVLSKGEITLIDKFFWIKNNLLLIVLCFSRNNGFYIVFFCEFVMICLWILYRKNILANTIKNMSINTGCILLVAGIVTGPVYTHLELNGEPVESLGIFLNQMAYVVACDGNMSESDYEFMGNLLPIEKYKETYRPCVVDRLKWDQDFNQEYLNSHLNQFVKTYISMFVKNPYSYVEAWALNTYGYWALNRWELNLDGNNIYKGNLGDIENGENYGIVPKSLLNMKSIFKIQDATVALAVITWLDFLIVLVIAQKRKWILGMIVAPTIGLIATLFIATPYAYWQRYGLAQYYLVPIYILMMVWLLKRES